jgi:hypothetical protein
MSFEFTLLFYCASDMRCQKSNAMFYSIFVVSTRCDKVVPGLGATNLLLLLLLLVLLLLLLLLLFAKKFTTF